LAEAWPMSLLHLLRKAKLRLSTEGFRETIKELIYVNRVMVAIEKDLEPEPSLLTPSMQKIIVNRSNCEEYQERFNIKHVVHYCRLGCEALLLFEGSELLGYQLWTRKREFVDLVKLGIDLKEDEAYGIELFVFPRFRGTHVTRTISVEAFNYMNSLGIKKVYGFFFRDNLKALWWHRAYLKPREIKQVRTTRLLFLELTEGRLTLKL
jgi:hypothetical protein